MKSKTVPIVPFKYEYYLYHRFRKHCVGPYRSIDDATYSDRKRIAETFAEKWTPDCHAIHDMALFGCQWSMRRKEPEWLVVNQLGRIITLKELYAVNHTTRTWPKNNRYWDYWDKAQATALRLVRKKDNVNKIKGSYAYFYKGIDRDGNARYNRCVRSFYRHVKTKNENRQNVGCMADKEYIVRGKRRYHNIPKWDDQSVSNFRYETSWKHNSKRRKQWATK